jgi:hypothetical protein
MVRIRLEEAKGKNSSQLDVICIREDGTEILFLSRPGPRAIETRQPVQNEVNGWRPGTQTKFSGHWETLRRNLHRTAPFPP